MPLVTEYKHIYGSKEKDSFLLKKIKAAVLEGIV